MDFFIREPQRPIIVDLGTELLVAKSWAASQLAD